MAYNANNITWNQLAQSLKDRLNIPTLELVNDLTTGGATKAASAETVKTLNTMITDHEKQIANETTPGHVKSSDTLTVDADGTAHAKQVEIVDNTLDGGRTKAASAETVKKLQSEVDGALKVNTYNANSTKTNLGSANVSLAFPIFAGWTSVTNRENLDIAIPIANFWGMIKLTLFSSYGSGNAGGGGEYIFQVGKVGATSYINTLDIVSLSPSFANCFYVYNMIFSDNHIVIPIGKSSNTKNNLGIKVEFFNLGDSSVNQGLLDTVLNHHDVGTTGVQPVQQSIFTHVGNSKADLATAITGKGVATSADATFATMVANINAIPSGKRQASFSLTPPVGSANFEYVVGGAAASLPYVRATVPFKPQFILANGFYNNTLNYLSVYLGINDGRSTNTVKLSGYSSATSNTTSYNLKGVTIDNGDGTFDFMLPVYMAQIPYTVTCFE